MKHRARTLALAAMTATTGLTACGDKSNEDTGSATSTSSASTEAVTSSTSSITSSSDTTATNSTTSSMATTAPTSSTGATEPTSTSDVTASEGNSFIPGEPDAGSGLECDVLAEDCPAGQKCMPYVRSGGSQWDGLKCVPVDPAPVAVGEACTAPGNGLDGLDNCDKHVMCWDVEANMGFCAAMCVDNDCAEGFNCFVANDAILNLCLQACDVDMPDCPPGTGCLPVLKGGVCAPA